MPLGRRRDPFDHPEWIFELRYDGFRALLSIVAPSSWIEIRNPTTAKPGIGSSCSIVRTVAPDPEKQAGSSCADASRAPAPKTRSLGNSV